MRRVPLYSSSHGSGRPRPPAAPPPPARAAARDDDDAGAAAPVPPASSTPSASPGPPPASAAARRRRRALALALLGGVLAAGAGFLAHERRAAAPIDAEARLQQIVQREIGRRGLAAPVAKAFRVIHPSVVRVRGYNGPVSGGKHHGMEGEALSIGSGVVIVDRGLILTSLHVVAGSPRLRVTFSNGYESDAELVGARPEQDLAVIQAATVPDDLVAATMRSTADLALGQPVAAVGFPFDVGLTVTEGVISGLGREFQTAAGRMPLRDLIQFDAAVNPGSSGGPLVTMEGEVVGIVTGILNPTDEGFFVGIAFAVPIESAAGAAGLAPF